MAEDIQYRFVSFSVQPRMCSMQLSFTTFIFFVSILSLVRTLFLILRDLKIMNVILVFTIVP